MPVPTLRFRLCALAAVSTIGTAGVLAPVAEAESPRAALAATAPAATSTADNFLKLWIPEWMGSHGAYTAAEADTLARRFSLIVTMTKKLTPYVAAMKSANPDLTLSVYRNATFGGSGLPAELYAHDAAGNRIHAIKWPTTYLMQLNQPAWTARLMASCQDVVAKSAYDSCYLDVLGSGPLTSVYLSSKPVSGGVPWTPTQWIGWTSAISRDVGSGLAKPVFGNGLGNGRRYFDAKQTSRPLVAATSQQVAAEMFIRDAYSPIGAYRSEVEWKKDVDMLVDTEAQGKGALTVTKVWTSATTAQVDAWHEYTLAAFLMGSGGRSRFCFLREKSPSSTMMDHPFNALNPGTPLGAYTYTGGVYRRDFTHAVVLANPGKLTVTVPFTTTYTALTGETVTGSVTLAPKTAKILTY